jgi:hypothetical protein
LRARDFQFFRDLGSSQVACVPEECHAGDAGNDLLEELKALHAQLFKHEAHPSDDVNSPLYEFVCKSRKALGLALRVSHVEGDILTFDVPPFAKLLPELFEQSRRRRLRGQKPDSVHPSPS